MQILARLSQAERPHADLTSARTITCIFSYMSLVHTGVEKSAKIMNRLSTNLYCLFPFILSRHYSYLSLTLEDLDESTLQLGCSKCSDNFQEVKKVIECVGHNLTLLAETGFGEGEICHRLVHPLASKEDKQSISLSAALLVRQRKMLRNILITHDSFKTCNWIFWRLKMTRKWMKQKMKRLLISPVACSPKQCCQCPT